MRFIPNNNILIDFISWIIIYFILTTIAVIITHISRDIKVIYRSCLYVIAVVIVVLFTFVMAFAYKSQQVNDYKTVLSMMTEKSTSEITSLLDEKETFIFLLTSEDCPYCIDLLPTIGEKISENTTLPIYYVKRENDTNSTLRELLRVETIPFLVKIEQGEIIQNYFDNPINFFY